MEKKGIFPERRAERSVATVKRREEEESNNLQTSLRQNKHVVKAKEKERVAGKNGEPGPREYARIKTPHSDVAIQSE